MEKIVDLSVKDQGFVDEVMERSGQDPGLCYQCGNCSAGCPYSFIYDYPVHKLMRLLQLGRKGDILKSRSIWLCVSCQACTTRCPNNIEVAAVMEVLRQMAQEQGYVNDKHVDQFFSAFLDSVQKHGRVFELGTFLKYVLASKKLTTDLDLGPKIVFKGKIGFRPHEIVGKEQVANIFCRVEGQENKRKI